MNDIATQNSDVAGEIDFLGQPSNIFDVERFEMVSKVAQVMSRASLIPDHMKVKDDPEATFSNCFIVANLSLTWGFDPFLVAQAVSILFGKMVLEGKLVRSVIKKSLGFDLSYRFFGNAGDMKRRVYVSDSPLIDEVGTPLDEQEIKFLIEQGSRRITVGTLEKWHTKSKTGGINDNWVKDEDKMFRERGSREWCRQWAPGLILGIYTPDEFDEQSDEYRATKARNITPAGGTVVANPLLDDKSRSRQSVPMEQIDTTTGEIVETPRSQQSSPRSTASKAQGDDASGSRQTSRLPDSKFREYGAALVRCMNAENLKPTHDSFWNGDAPAVGPDYELARAIYGIHSDRLKNGSNLQAAIIAVTKLIEKDFPL